MLMICIEWWAYEIGTFLMGTWASTARENLVGSSEAPSLDERVSSLAQAGS